MSVKAFRTRLVADADDGQRVGTAGQTHRVAVAKHDQVAILDDARFEQALLGALLLFAILALVMMLTRKLDWYRVMGNNSPTREP